MISKLSFLHEKGRRALHYLPYRNLALEKNLAFHTEPGECILFLRQNQRTLVIGKNQDARETCSVERLQADGVFFARRLTGGGAVFHDFGNLSFSFCERKADYDLSRHFSIILKALQSLGLSAEIIGGSELACKGRVFSETACYENKGFCFHHGTLMVDVDRNALSNYLQVLPDRPESNGGDSVPDRLMNLKEECPDLTIGLLAERLLEAFQDICRLPAEPFSEERLDQEQLRKDAALFSSWDWLYGRKIPFSSQEVRP